MNGYTLENMRANWRNWFRERRYDTEYQEKILSEWTTLMRTREDVAIGEEMKDEYIECCRRNIAIAQSSCPIGFWKPSWEQAQIMNAWHPDFEPETAPGGYQSICNFSANRIGKTSGHIIFTESWLIPNDPEWVMFEQHVDPDIYNVPRDPSSGIKRKSRGVYSVWPKPDWKTWRRTGRLVYPWQSDSPMGPCDVWHGVENDTHWKDKICGVFGGENGYLAWIPKDAVARRPDGGTAIYVQERKIVTRWGQTIQGKTYNSDVQDWAGQAVRIVSMDEGFPVDKFKESTMRVQAGGFYLWSYTPAEPANIGVRSLLAKQAYRGQRKLVGRAKFFINFKMEDAPEWIIPTRKLLDDLERLAHDPDQGEAKVRAEGGFFESSPAVFNNFERERNVLPVDGSDVLLAIRGEVPERWRKDLGDSRADRLAARLHGANIVRGMDEGLANPTACCWRAILRSGEGVTFREWEKSGLSVGERCEAIIDRSGNTRDLLNPGVDPSRRRYREIVQPKGMRIRRTLADSKMFRRNPESPQDDWTATYANAGLRLERATNIGPAARCDYANDGLRGDPSRQHLLEESLPGCMEYVTRDCPKLIERLENYLWQQIATGSHAGEFTDKPEGKDDHTIDAWTYLAASKLRWKDEVAPAPPHRMTVNPMTGYVH